MFRYLLRVVLLSCSLVVQSGFAKEPKHIVILGTNDFHGALLPAIGKTKDKDPVEYSQGGAAVLGAYVNSFREHYKDRFLFLDAGDQWQGSLESNYFEGQTVVDVFNRMGLQAAAIGNHEFDFGPVGEDTPNADPQGALKRRLKQANFPYLSANLSVKKNARASYEALPRQKAFKIFHINGVKVGVLGLTTEETPVTTRPGFVENANFHSLVQTTYYYSKLLRSTHDVDLVILLAHAGTRCNGPDVDPLMENKIRTKNDAGDRVCQENEELYKLLKLLKPGTVDAVIGGHAHEIVHHWINGVPVIQSGKFGQYLHLLHVKYEGRDQRPTIEIEGPVPVCEKIFQIQKSCDGRAKPPEGGRGALVQATLFNNPIVPDAGITTYLSEVGQKLGPIKSKFVAKIEDGADIVHEKFVEAPMGNLVADAIRWAAKSDFSLVNRGGIRDSWKSLESITFGDVYRVLPFDNFIKIATVTGAQLKSIIQQAYNSPDKDVWPVSGLQVLLNKANHPEFSTAIFDLRTSSKMEIQDEKIYTLAVPDFVAEGGDNMGKVFTSIQTKIVDAGFMREVLEAYLKTWKEPVNVPQLLDPSLPRVIVIEQ